MPSHELLATTLNILTLHKHANFYRSLKFCAKLLLLMDHMMLPQSKISFFKSQILQPYIITQAQ